MPHSLTQTMHPIWHIPAAGSGTAARSTVLPSSLSAAAVGTGIAIAVIAPWLVHHVPIQGAPLGPKLLPIFFAPLLAALLLRLPLAVAVSAVTPIVSRFLTGMPPEAVLPGMVLQIALFVIVIRALRRFHWAVAVPVAYLASLIVAGIVTAAMPDIATVSVSGTLETGWQGIAILTGLGLLAHKTLR